MNHARGRDGDIRIAQPSEVASIVALDPIAREFPRRADFVRRAIEARECFVATRDADVVAYAILDYSFFTNGFIPLLWVHDPFRRQGIATALVRHLEGLCRTPKLFTSTNVSNAPMHELLRKRGFAVSGLIDNLDPGDPEIVYFKLVGEGGA